MGRSMAPIVQLKSEDTPPGRFTALGSSFQVRRQGQRMIHRQSRLDEAGQVIWSLDLPVDYVIGSGTRGHSYLFEREGYLFQTPISWFSQKRVWDRSPGMSPDAVAGRPVVPECLFCHANHTHPRPDSRNAYDRPVFDGYAVGCERCHGPGAIHVKERKAGVAAAGLIDHTIVNPGKLSPELRDAVCAQCHLTGEPRVLRRGRGLYDFRPGLPLYLFWAVFVQDRPRGAEHKAVNHVEQMHFSRCYQRSTGTKKLGCVSCHDAHEEPTEVQRVQFYRSRCLECHRVRGCKLPEDQRLSISKEDSCIVCHMPPYAASDIAHTAATDHRIVRRRSIPANDRDEPTVVPLPLSFYRGSSSLDETEQTRDLGIALSRIAALGKGDAPSLARKAVDLLEKSMALFPDDLPAWEAKGQAFALLNRFPESLAAFEEVLARAPLREVSLHGAALLAQRCGDRDKALAYWRRAIEVDPWAADYRGNLARLLVSARAWDEARPHVQAWLRLDPGSFEAREMHERFLRRDGDRVGAKAERERIRRLRGGGAGSDKKE
jgi:hypothetical protein